MRIIALTVSVAALALLGACDEKKACTPEDAQAKLAEMTTLTQEIATSNPAKLTELLPRMQEIQGELTAAGDDPAAACKALDDLIAELKG